MNRRNTPQRKIVYNVISEMGHVTSDSLIEYIQGHYENISLATIYRNINILLEEKEIKRMKFQDVEIYETVKHKHYHYICKKCNMICDIDPKEFVHQFRDIKKIGQDTVDEQEFCFYGTCHSCSKI